MRVTVVHSAGSSQAEMFAAADEFSHLLDDDVTATSSSLADLIGSSAVRRHDNAGKCFALAASSNSNISVHKLSNPLYQ